MAVPAWAKAHPTNNDPYQFSAQPPPSGSWRGAVAGNRILPVLIHASTYIRDRFLLICGREPDEVTLRAICSKAAVRSPLAERPPVQDKHHERVVRGPRPATITFSRKSSPAIRLACTVGTIRCGVPRYTCDGVASAGNGTPRISANSWPGPPRRSGQQMLLPVGHRAHNAGGGDGRQEGSWCTSSTCPTSSLRMGSRGLPVPVASACPYPVPF